MADVTDRPDAASLALADLLDLVGTDEATRSLSRELRAGSASGAIALAEPDAGSDLAASRLHATRDGDDWVLDGQKKYIAGGAGADHLLVLARTDIDAPADQGFTAFVVPHDAPGVTFQAIPDVLGRRGFDKVFLEDVRLPSSALVGDESRGWFLGERIREAWLAPSTAERIALLMAWCPPVRDDDGGASRARAAEVATGTRVAGALLAHRRSREAHLVAVAAAQRAWCEGGTLATGLVAAEGDGPAERGVDAHAAGVAQGPLEVHRNALARDLGLLTGQF